jgi:hypothetical protein
MIALVGDQLFDPLEVDLGCLAKRLFTTEAPFDFAQGRLRTRRRTQS